MKTHRITAILLCIGVMLQASSCLVLVKKEHSGKPGWNKNTNNPHNPNTTNPGKAKGHRK